MNKLKRVSSVLMVLCMLFSLIAVPAQADGGTKHTVKLYFGEAKWTPLEDVPFADDQYFDGDNLLPEYAGSKVVVIPILAEATDGAQFEVQKSAQLAIRFNPQVLRYNSAKDVCSEIKKVGRNSTTTMGVSGSENPNKVNEEGVVDLVFSDVSTTVFSVENGKPIAQIFFFLTSESEKYSQSDVSFVVGEAGSAHQTMLVYDTNKQTNESYLHEIDATALGKIPAYDPGYNVIISEAPNGKVTSAPANPVAEGATVTLTVAPEAGYRLKDGTLKAEGAVADSLKKTVDNVYTFTMGTSDVTVSAEFERIPQSHNVNVPANITSSPGNPVEEGATVTLTVAPEPGYRLKDGTLTAEGAVADSLKKTGDNDNVYTFTMGTSDVNVSAEWEPETPVYKIEVVQTTGGTVEANKTTAKTGEEVELTVTPDTNNGYILKELTVTDKDGKIDPTRSSDMTAAAAVYKFTVRTSDVKVEATFINDGGTPKPVKILPAVPEEGGKVESDKTEAVKGEEVTLTVTPDLNKGYVLKKLTVTGSDGKDVACQRKETESTNYAFSEYVFKMPDGDEVTEVTVKAEFGIPRLVILPEKAEHGSVTSDKQPSAYVGETVTLTVKPETDYQLKVDFPKVTKADGTPITPNKVDEKTYTFVMENSDATVSVEFEPTTPSGKEITVIYASGEGDGDSQTKKERLPFNLPGNPGFTSPAGKSLDGWTLPDNQFYAVGTEITELADNSELTAHYSESTTPACYVATAVYGSYDCPEVWTLRRFRDHVLAKTWYGRLFIKLYYAVSPTAVRLFGDMAWFRNFWRGKLDSMVASLQADGFESTPYQDMDW